MSEIGCTMHVHWDIRGLLQWPKRKLRGFLVDERGRKASADEVREWLLDRLAEGKKILPVGEPCEGFSFETGCPGHRSTAAPPISSGSPGPDVPVQGRSDRRHEIRHEKGTR